MNALVIYESMFGNTHEVADAIAIGLSRTLTTLVRQTADIDPGTLVADLVVIGAPTQAFVDCLVRHLEHQAELR